MRRGEWLCAAVCIAVVSGAGRAEDARALLPEPAPLPFEERNTPYSMVYYHLTDDEAFARWCLGSIRDLGATHVQAALWWEQYDRLDDGVTIDDEALRRVDLFVDIAHELGLTPGLRLGDFDRTTGRLHPEDDSGTADRYAEWVGGIAARYRGRISHYVLGDEINRSFDFGWQGTAREYLDQLLIPLSRAIRKNDPDALIAATATSSSPATEWQLELIREGLPRYADGITSNYWHTIIEDWRLVQDLMDRARAVWPKVKFFSNGVGYVTNREGVHDAQQAAIVAQTMYNLWRGGYDNAPYYLLRFSLTEDTRENYGLVKFGDDYLAAEFSDAWHAYQTIAQTFYSRDDLAEPGFKIELTPAQTLTADDGTTVRLAPPDPVVHAYVRSDRQLLLYLVYPVTSHPRDGRWNVRLHSDAWGGPQRIPLSDYRARNDLGCQILDDGTLLIENVSISVEPTILTLRRHHDE